jgi:hypothetical protein
MNYSEDKLFPMFLFYYKAINQIKQEDIAKFVTVEFSKLEMFRIKGSDEIKTTITSLKTIPCSELSNRETFRSFIVDSKNEREALIEGGVCVDPEDHDVHIGRKSKDDPFYQQVTWRLLPCSLPSGCAKREDLAKVTFVPMLPKPVQDLGNKKHPIRYVTSAEEVMYLSVSFNTRQSFVLMKTEIVDEAGFLFGDSIAKSYASINSVSFSWSDRSLNQTTCTPEEIKTRSCTPYFTQSFLNTPQKLVIKRQYKGIVETFSEFGGMADMLFIFFYFPYSLYNSKVLKEKLVEAIHGVKKPTSSKLKAKIHHLKSKDSVSCLPVITPTVESTSARSYSQLYDKILTFLDIVKLVKELESLKTTFREIQQRSIDPDKDMNDPHMVNTSRPFIEGDPRMQVLSSRKTGKPERLLQSVKMKSPILKKNIIGKVFTINKKHTAEEDSHLRGDQKTTPADEILRSLTSKRKRHCPSPQSHHS